jgi:hypothetical protein
MIRTCPNSCEYFYRSSESAPQSGHRFKDIEVPTLDAVHGDVGDGKPLGLVAIDGIV